MILSSNPEGNEINSEPAVKPLTQFDIQDDLDPTRGKMSEDTGGELVS